MSDFINEITKVINNVASEVRTKTDEIITIQSLKSQQRMSAREIEKHYVELGKIVLMKYGDGVEVAQEAVPHCEEVLRLQAQIAQFEKDIAAYKANGPVDEPGAEEAADETVEAEEAAADEAATEEIVDDIVAEATETEKTE